MKFLTTLFAFNLLCVWCFGFEDCEDDDILLCATTEQIRAEVAETYPYEEGETVAYLVSGSSDNQSAIGTVTRVEDGLSGRFECKEVDEFVLSIKTDVELLHVHSFIIGDTLSYRHLITRNGVGYVKILEVGLELPGTGAANFDVVQPNQRIVADTVLEAGAFRNVLVTEYDGNDLLRAAYLTIEGGFVQFDYQNGVRIYPPE